MDEILHLNERSEFTLTSFNACGAQSLEVILSLNDFFLYFQVESAFSLKL